MIICVTYVQSIINPRHMQRMHGGYGSRLFCLSLVWVPEPQHAREDLVHFVLHGCSVQSADVGQST